MRYLNALILSICLALVVACSPSQSVIQTAIAQTQIAQPTNTQLPTFTLTPTGNGTGVSTLTMASSVNTVLTLSGGASFYSDSAGTLNKSQTWNLVTGTGRIIYIRCTSVASLVFEGKLISSFDWGSTTNACSISGDISRLPNLTRIYMYAANTSIYGSISNLKYLTLIYVGDSTTISGDITQLTSLIYINVAGNNTLTGSASGLLLLTYISLGGNNTVIIPNVINIKGLCLLNNNNLVFTSANANQILADFVANKDYPKPRSERTINLSGKTGSGSPTGQGITDKAFQAGYKSPNNTGPAFWTVTTR